MGIPVTALRSLGKAKRYRTVALVALVAVVATTAVFLARRSDDSPTRSAVSETSRLSLPPDVEVDPSTSDVRITDAGGSRSSARVAGAPPSSEPAPEPTSGLPGTPASGGYELAEPGDRTPPPPPDFFRALNGSLDNSKGAPLFASHCPYSHSRPDDPLVYPRKPGASHLHDFFGNKGTDAYSTDDSLRSSGATTCANFRGDSAAYWVPALYESGRRVEPASLNAYYTAGGKDNRMIEPFPRGLKMLIKDAEASKWFCVGDRSNARFYDDPPLCAAGEHLGLQIVFPDCWDGKYLDVPDHRKHVAYSSKGMCPSSHPVFVPQLILFIDYMTARGGVVELAPQNDPSSPHADFVNSWDQAMLTKFVRDCINSGVHCGGSPPS
jgi:hypothetical protein